MQHITAGASFLRKPSSLLVFSGGKTNLNSEIAEASSYSEILLYHQHLHGSAIQEAILQERTVAECWATDSYQNLLFSIIYFWKTVGRWPESITVITHAFKQDRFLQCHADALRWPRGKIRVQGINPPFTDEELRDVMRSEAKCKKQFEQDPYGASEPLAGKRQQRRWDGKAMEGVLGSVLDEDVKAQLKKLLEWKGGSSGKEIYPHILPWG